MPKSHSQTKDFQTWCHHCLVHHNKVTCTVCREIGLLCNFCDQCKYYHSQERMHAAVFIKFRRGRTATPKPQTVTRIKDYLLPFIGASTYRLRVVTVTVK